MAGVHKRFRATVALGGVDLTMGQSEVHGLLGENGAGKSTLMRILSGALKPDAGAILLDGEPFLPRHPRQARQSGIAMIHQELTLAPHLTVQENILLGVEPTRFGWVRSGNARALARAALADLDHGDLPLDERAFRLPIPAQQIVEIARALLGKPRVLVMDEPTSSLGRADTDKLFEVIGRLKALGVSIVYISHFLEECLTVCDRYTVLRDGRTVGTGVVDDAAVSRIVHLMVGRELEEVYPPARRDVGDVALRVGDLAGREKPVGVSFEVHRGEIFGIAGLVGSGRTETLRTIFGLDHLASGRVEAATGAARPPSPRRSLRHGIALLSENRKEEGLLLERSIADNVTLTRLAPVMRLGLVSPRRQRDAAAGIIDRLRIRPRSVLAPVKDLSGGNQQKVAFGRLLHHDGDVLLLDEPTRGIDVASKLEIYRIMGALAAQGKAIVFVSSYLPELLGVCDTIAVMCRGHMVEIAPRADWTEHALMRAMVGQEAAG